jgi:UDP-N-acetylmuramoyl-tripeptide--D-alanyl-D-alanine ligase
VSGKARIGLLLKLSHKGSRGVIRLFLSANFSNYINIGLLGLIIIANTFALYFSAYKFLQSMQLNSYRAGRYFSWIKYNFKSYFNRLLALSALSAASLIVVNILFYVYTEIFSSGIGLVFYFIFMSIFIFNEMLRTKNTPIVYTKRMKRLIAAFLTITAAVSALFVYLSNNAFLDNETLFKYTKFSLITIMPILLPFLVSAAGIVMYPFEEINNKRFVLHAKKVLENRPKLVKIAIAGSYGKTSVKNILNTILSQRYSVLSTPASYNTPMGLCKVINKDLKDSHQIFIAEMGAKNIGDIRYLCSFVKPNYGIMASVGNQHLETFRTLENIKKAKYELVRHMDQNGLCVFNGNDPVASEYFNICPIKKIKVGFDKRDAPVYAYADDISVSKEGSSFALNILDENPIASATKLLGRHNIENVLLAAALAHKLGLSAEELAAGISKLEPVEHRLKLMTNAGGINIIDDSFNANVTGAQCALEVLNEFPSNKIIITPGFIELGDLEKKENFLFGKKIAAVADYAVLVGPNKTIPIKAGLTEGGFDEDKIIVADSRDDAVKRLKPIMKSGDTILFENDLPDNYSED